jgi:hypothetical protein
MDLFLVSETDSFVIRSQAAQPLQDRTESYLNMGFSTFVRADILNSNSSPVMKDIAISLLQIYVKTWKGAMRGLRGLGIKGFAVGARDQG